MLTSFDQSCIDKDLRHQHYSPTKFFNKEIQISSRLPVLRFIFILAKINTTNNFQNQDFMVHIWILYKHPNQFKKFSISEVIFPGLPHHAIFIEP